MNENRPKNKRCSWCRKKKKQVSSCCFCLWPVEGSRGSSNIPLSCLFLLLSSCSFALKSSTLTAEGKKRFRCSSLKPLEWQHVTSLVFEQYLWSWQFTDLDFGKLFFARITAKNTLLLVSFSEFTIRLEKNDSFHREPMLIFFSFSSEVEWKMQMKCSSPDICRSH